MPAMTASITLRKVVEKPTHQSIVYPALGLYPAFQGTVKRQMCRLPESLVGGSRVKLDTKIYQIARPHVRTGLRGAAVRVEKRRDGSVAARFRDRYLNLAPCAQRPDISFVLLPGSTFAA